MIPSTHPSRLSTALRGLLAGALLAGAGTLWSRGSAHSADTVAVPPPASDEAASAGHAEKALLAGGCFWGIQGVFQHVQGVQRVVSGYAGGAAGTAHYDDVATGRTGHAESVEITFDPAQVSYGKLLQIFFAVAHDPTEVNRQGPDTGSQYRSAIFPTTATQQRVAQAYIAQLDAGHVFGAPVATRIEDGAAFYPAEAYHQDFLAEHPSYPYIVINDLPKVVELKQLFPAQYREQPVLLKPAS